MEKVLAGLLCWVASLGVAYAATPGALEIYFIDVEGGQSTLVVTPEKHTLLIDAGWASDGKGFNPGDPAQGARCEPDRGGRARRRRFADRLSADHALSHRSRRWRERACAAACPFGASSITALRIRMPSETSPETRDAFAAVLGAPEQGRAAHRAAAGRSAALQRHRGHGGELRRRDALRAAARRGRGERHVPGKADPRGRSGRESAFDAAWSCATGSFDSSTWET